MPVTKTKTTKSKTAKPQPKQSANGANGHKSQPSTMIKLSLLKRNQKNPRLIKDHKFELLKKSLQDFPQMMDLRPIIVDKSNTVLGGNMRLKALQEIGYKEIPSEWVKRADTLTEEQKREFIIKDNSSFGEYDWDMLANEWDDLPLAEWGVDMPDDWLLSSGDAIDEADEIYNHEIISPIYEPKNEKPSVNELFDRKKVKVKLKEIAKLNIDTEIKEFLVAGAERFTEYDFAKIADFYAHADKEVQMMMESLALIIIDYNKAIELGFIELSKNLQEMYADDYEKK